MVTLDNKEKWILITRFAQPANHLFASLVNKLIQGSFQFKPAYIGISESFIM